MLEVMTTDVVDELLRYGICLSALRTPKHAANHLPSEKIGIPGLVSDTRERRRDWKSEVGRTHSGGQSRNRKVSFRFVRNRNGT
jgi:hypothetical protein